MNSIVYVGMDVHKEQYTLCCYSYDRDKVKYKPDSSFSDYACSEIYGAGAHTRYEGEVTFVCGYEAGCPGIFIYITSLEIML